MPINPDKKLQQPRVELRKDIVPLDWDEYTRAEDYEAWDNDLTAAANVALALGKPLLLTGEPGVGKSEFAKWLAYELGMGTPEKFVIKSTTEATDLFYHYDTLRRFHEAQIAGSHSADVEIQQKNTSNQSNVPVDPLKYINYNALGRAILYSKGKKDATNEQFVSAQMSKEFLKDFPQQPRRTVVLIDEIDKAPRDVPNDILDEIDKMEFTIRELENRRLKAKSEMRPIVIITSNSERDLPEPFLRRCVFYNIPFPEDDEILKKIIIKRTQRSEQKSSVLLDDVLKLFNYLRSGEVTLTRKPGLAELLDLIYELTLDSEKHAKKLIELPKENIAVAIKTTLLKHARDQEQVNYTELNKWLENADSLSRKNNA